MIAALQPRHLGCYLASGHWSRYCERVESAVVRLLLKCDGWIEASLHSNIKGTEMALTRQVITSLMGDGPDMLGTKVLAVKIADESIVSGSLLTVESNHFCVLKSRGAVLNVYETGQYALTTPDKPLLGSIAQGFFGGNSPWVYEVIYINRSKLLIRSQGVATSAEMAEMAYQVDYYIHVDTKQAALDLITHLPFNGHLINTQEVADYAGPAIEQAINQVVQVTKMEDINEHIQEVRELVKQHLTDFLATYGITLNDLKILIMPKDERMRELISLQAIGLAPIEAVRYYLALRMAEKGLVSAPNAAAGLPFNIGGSASGFYSIDAGVGSDSGTPSTPKTPPPATPKPWGE
jgi:membrane protease subunit (stomatin/prohibitin family)